MKHFYRRSKSLKNLFYRDNGKDKEKENESKFIEAPLDSKHKPILRCFSYEEIHQATDGFHPDNLVGSGGYAEVYRGVLENGRVIAVKRLKRGTNGERREKEFLSELGTVCHVHHPNVSALLGCSIDRDLNLIFEFSSHGSVSSHLHGGENSPAMSWKLRYSISVGIARGLHYLHKGCKRRIIHRDIKASNILLTANFEPQISDFGLATWLPPNWTHRATKPIEGTFGYLAPEYFKYGIIGEKIDVFAYGVLLLEIVSGRKPVDGSHRSLLSWAKPYLSGGMVKLLVDPRLGDDYDVDQLRRIAFLASLCIRANAALRPSMTEVLELVTEAEIPKHDWNALEDDEEDLFDFDDFDDLDECDSPATSSTMTCSSCHCNSLRDD